MGDCTGQFPLFQRQSEALVWGRPRSDTEAFAKADLVGVDGKA